MRNILGRSAKLVMLVLLCAGLIMSCKDDDDDNLSPNSEILGNINPGYGFLVNSTDYRLVIDLDEQETFEVTLNPGATMGIALHEKKTHVIHVLMVNGAGRVVTEYVNSFYIDDIPLDNQLNDFVCNWYVEFFAESGFVNKFGT